MKKPMFFTSLIAFAAFIGLITGTGDTFCQTTVPPFSQLDGKPFDPANEPDIDQFIVNYQDKMPKKIRGAMYWNAILTPSDGDPMKPKTKGAVLTEIKGLSHAYLEPFTKTTPVTLTGEQEIYYVYEGKGKVAVGGKTAELRDGIGVLVPPGIEFTFENTGGSSLAMYVITEPIPSGFTPKSEIVVKDEYSREFSGTHGHWAHIGGQPFFEQKDGLAVLLAVRPVYFAPMTMGQPHSHFKGAEEIWFAIRGNGAKELLGKQMRDFKPGTAFKVPPDGKNPHSTINITESSFKAFWMMKNVGGTPLPESQLDSNPYDAAKEPNIDMYMRGWKESVPEKTHGSLIERAVLLRGDPLNPTKRGAVLSHVNRLSHASLFSHVSTAPYTPKGEQELFYVFEGKGTVTGGGKTYDLYPGTAFLVPDGVEFTMTNTSDNDMKMYLIAEPVYPGFVPKKNIVWRDENLEPYNTVNGHWAHHNKWLIRKEEGLSDLYYLLTVTIIPGAFAQPHSHPSPIEEVWIPLDDNAFVMLGKQVRALPAGTAYMIPPNGTTPHANFNVSDKPIKYFYFGRGWDK